MLVTLNHHTLWNDYYTGSAVAQCLERSTSGQEVMGSIPAPYWFCGCQYNVTSWDRSHGLPAVSLWQHVKLSDISLRAGPCYSLVADKKVKKPNKQTRPFYTRCTKSFWLTASREGCSSSCTCQWGWPDVLSIPMTRKMKNALSGAALFNFAIIAKSIKTDLCIIILFQWVETWEWVQRFV